LPSTPDPSRREQLLGVMADLVARGGAGPLLLPPVRPGSAAFPEPWKPTCAGVQALLRRLAWHAGGLGQRTIAITDERLGAPPTERKPQTRVEITEVRAKELAFTLVFVGEDDVVGTLAHEIGVAYAALHRPDEADPYRTSEQPVITIDGDRDLERGSIAAVYLGLGVIAANAAYQQYSSRVGIDAYQPTIHEVHRAGYVNMSDLAFLLAVQAVVRGEEAPPAGLGGPQRDEVTPWIEALAGSASELRARLGIPATAEPGAREAPVCFADLDLRDEEAAPVAKRNGFRWETSRRGVGIIAGLASGVGLAFAVAPTEPMFYAITLGGVAAGHFLGGRVRVIRCSACVTPIGAGAQTCRKCGAVMRGDIARLADRLEAEERLEDESST
jgi:hypothetical protein